MQIRSIKLTPSDRIPDETTTLDLLEKHDLGKQILEVVKAHFKANGMAMKQSKIIDATLIATPSSTKHEKKETDPEIHQTKKGAVVLRHLAASRRSGRSPSAWIARTVSSTQWKPRPPMCMI
jgi:hypothetical protein